MKARLAAALALGLAVLAQSRSVLADPLDPALERFVTAESAGCRTASGVYLPQTSADGTTIQ